MSMMDYPINESHALYIDEAAAIRMCLKQALRDGGWSEADMQYLRQFEKQAPDLNDPAVYDKLVRDFGFDVNGAVDILNDADVDGMVWTSAFTGTAETAESTEDCPGLAHNLEDDWLLYFLPDNTVSYFKAAYGSLTEMVDEFKAKLSVFLPDDFDWEEHVCSIRGTYCA